MSPARLHQLTERLTSLFRASVRQTATAHGLKLVQLEALIYLSMANRYSDTPAALTEYLAVTKGTISQTLKALEKRGLIAKKADIQDGRVLHCQLTDEGQAVASDAYPAGLFRGLSRDDLAQAEPALEPLLRQLQAANGFRAFGQCSTCRFFQRRSRGGRCGLTGEDLSASDTKKICREHEAPLPA